MKTITRKHHPSLYSLVAEVILAQDLPRKPPKVADRYDLKALDAMAEKLNRTGAEPGDFAEELKEDASQRTEQEMFADPLDEEDVVLADKYGIHALRKFLNEYFESEGLD